MARNERGGKGDAGSLTFAAGETSKSVVVQIVGDTTFEPDETFFVNLSSPNNATISDAQGVATIVVASARNAPAPRRRVPRSRIQECAASRLRGSRRHAWSTAYARC